jgi:hypothetical protein
MSNIEATRAEAPSPSTRIPLQTSTQSHSVTLKNVQRFGGQESLNRRDRCRKYRSLAKAHFSGEFLGARDVATHRRDCLRKASNTNIDWAAHLEML